MRREALPTGTQVERFRSLVAQSLGMRFDDDKLPLLSRTLAHRIRANRLACADRYLDERLGSLQEARAVATALSVNETYFFRDPGHFAAFDALLRDYQRTGRQRLRILSAGSASGEEAYSLAMVADSVLENRQEWDLAITAIDLDPQMIAKATAGRYTPWSLRQMPEVYKQRYLRAEGKRWRVDPAIRQMVSFECRNLLSDDALFWRSEAFDVIFCRNVLMYFTADAMQRFIAKASSSLVPGGLLFLGHAENLRVYAHPLELRHTHGSFYYRRPLQPGTRSAIGAAPSPAEGNGRRKRPAAPPNQRQPAASSPTPQSRPGSRRGRNQPTQKVPEPATDPLALALELLREERFADALAALPGVVSASDQTRFMLLRIVLQTAAGDLDAAQADCSLLLEDQPLSAESHHARALCLEQMADADAAIEEYRSAAYLDPQFAMPHLRIGVLARRAGDLKLARRELGLAAVLFADELEHRLVLFGGGFGRQALRALCEAELLRCGDSA